MLTTLDISLALLEGFILASIVFFAIYLMGVILWLTETGTEEEEGTEDDDADI